MSSLVLDYSFRAMGSSFFLKCFPQNNLSKKDCLEIFKLAKNEVLRIENKLTEFKDSPFNEINKYAGIKAIQVDSEIFNIIKYCQSLSDMSNGLFDITSSTYIYHLKKHNFKKSLFQNDEIEELKSLVDYRKIVLDEKEMSVYLPHQKLRIGLGGIGKGYAVDLAYNLLEKKGMYNFYINGSGDIRVHSHHNAPRKWKIGIQNPFNPNFNAGLIQLKEGSVATSGNSKQKGHIFNRKKQEFISTTVLAKTAVDADTYGTILINLDESSALEFLDEKNLIGILITNNGKTILSKRAIRYFGK